MSHVDDFDFNNCLQFSNVLCAARKDQCGAHPQKRDSSNKVNGTGPMNNLLTPICFLFYQKEIQKDMRTSAQTLAEIVKNTENFLKENGEKLSQEDKTILEQKLNEAKTKCLLLSQKAEESKKELDKAMTTAIKQETEKVFHTFIQTFFMSYGISCATYCCVVG